MALKITGKTTSCGTCPFYSYYSGGAYTCSKVDEVVLDKDTVAPFCPLPDYPSHIIAEMDTTINVMRKGNELPFEIVLLSHVAARLKTRLTARASGIKIPVEKDQEVYLGIDYIRGISLRPFEINFIYKNELYKLAPDADRLRLMKAKDNTGELWYEINIKR